MTNKDMAMPTVDWRRVPISPYKAYEISSDGRVRRSGRELKGYVDRYGYQTVQLYFAGLPKRFKIHRLVCEAFHGPCPEGLECAHLNSDKSDNRADNLRWVTRSENQRHNIERGVRRGGILGDRHPSAKLSENIVLTARSRHAAGESGRSLAKEFGVTSAVMSRALRGASWSRVATPCAQGDPHAPN